ncbi:MAG: 23S rRNA (uracil(1939)-C(5))-methyltransferase RlmD [Candidatus Erwinia impunctatus]|nr:23S rRNA (uracil(1939)-C(5))-methyltransferase RlmD [Culicoides impunctatus]
MVQFYSVKRRVTTRQKITAIIDDVDGSGQGVAHYKGKTIFIPGALPGEQVDVELVEDKRRWAKGEMKKCSGDNPERRQPRCIYFHRCGGCQLQHMSASLQQQSKSASLRRLLRDSGVTENEPIEILSGESYGCRRRARLGLLYAQGKLQMGYRQEASDKLVSVHECPVLVPVLGALLVPLYETLSSLQAVKRLGHVELVMADNGPVVSVRHLEKLSGSDREKLECFSHKLHLALFLAPETDTLEQITGEEPWYQICDLQLTFSPQDFIQINRGLNEKMVQLALSWLALTREDRLLDLFCGMGNFSLPASEKVKSVVGVEGVEALVARAKYNAVCNQLHNVSFYQHNLENDVKDQPWAREGFSKVLLDPARAGAPGVMGHIVNLSPQAVVYVSCNPTTLARDSQALIAAGYEIKRIALLDMFPHTAHVESMVLFSRK